MVQLNLEIDDEVKQFSIPENWDEVTVEQYSKVWSIPREGRTEIEISADILAIFSGMDEDDIYMLPPNEFNKLVSVLQFTTVEVEENKVDSIMIDGEEYFLKKDYDKLTMGEVISLNILIEDSNNNIATKMAEMLCIFLRKKKDNGKLETFKKSFMERAEIFKRVPITNVNNLLLFFSDGKNLSEVNTNLSSEVEK